MLAEFGDDVSFVRAGRLTQDGRQIILTLVRAETGFDVGNVDLGEPDSYRSLIASPSNEYGGELTPEQSWVAFGSDETGTFEVYVQRFPDGGGRRAVTIGGGSRPVWTADSRYLVFNGLNRTEGSGGITRLPVSGLNDPSGSLTFGTAEDLFDWQYYLQIDPRSQYDMTADGERFLVISATAGAVEGGRMILVQNWFGELERLAPPR